MSDDPLDFTLRRDDARGPQGVTGGTSGRRHPLQTEDCPALPALARGIAGGWSADLAAHLATCPFCALRVAMLWHAQETAQQAIDEAVAQAAGALDWAASEYRRRYVLASAATADGQLQAVRPHECVFDQVLERLPAADADSLASRPIAVSQGDWGVGARWLGDRLELELATGDAARTPPLLVRLDLDFGQQLPPLEPRHAMLGAGASQARGECELEPVPGDLVRLRLTVLEPTRLAAEDLAALIVDLAGGGPLRTAAGWPGWLARIPAEALRTRLAEALEPVG